MDKVKRMALAMFALVLAFPSMGLAQTPNLQQILQHYIADLQKNRSDYSLREKIIVHVRTMKPAPVVPEEARKYINRGMAATEDGKSEKDYRNAIGEFQKAVDIAPWLGTGYRNLAVMQDRIGEYDQALQNMKLYLLTNPSPADAEAAKTLADKIEYRRDKAAREASPEALAEKKRQQERDLVKSLEGVTYIRNWSDKVGWAVTTKVEIRSGEALFMMRMTSAPKGLPLAGDGDWFNMRRAAIQGRTFVIDGGNGGTFTISENGNTIAQRRNDGQSFELIRQ